MAGIDPVEYMKRINIQVEREETARFDTERQRSILSFARQAGIDTSTPEGRKLAFETYDKPLSDDGDTLFAEAQIFLESYNRKNPNEKIDIGIAQRMILNEREKEKSKRKKIDFSIREKMQAGFGKNLRGTKE
jgi:(p)ppGpp synthase/HD superfamily hydrolase